MNILPMQFPSETRPNMKSVEEIMENRAQYSLWRMMRNESFAWNVWEHHPKGTIFSNASFLMLPSIKTKTSSDNSEQPPSSLSTPTETTFFYHYCDSSKHLLDWTFSNVASFSNVAFPFIVENPVIKRPDYKYEVFWLIHQHYSQVGMTKFHLWGLNPETKDVLFTDIMPLLISLDLY